MDHFEAIEDNAGRGRVDIELPVLPLRDVVVYPHMVIPLFVGRAKSIRALDNALAHNKQIVLVAQKSASEDEPAASDLFHVGTVATILQMLKLPDGTVKVLVEGEYRARIACLTDHEDCFSASLEVMVTEEATEAESEIYKHTALDQFERFIQINKKIPSEVLSSLQNIDDIGRLADTLAAHMALKLDEKQKVLEMLGSRERLEYLMAKMETEIDLVEVEKRIRGRVKKQMEKSQREYYLNEQMKAIQKELGDMDETGGNDMDELRRRIEAAGMPEEALKKTLAEHKKLQMMSPMSAEATVVRGYIDWMLQVPWTKRSKVRLDMQRAQNILDEDHFGLEEVKERIIEYLAVQKRVRKLKGPILCLVGPPGVGKTSLGKSIARATNREYVRMALGGVRDEAEIRGHRRTYIGSMPGKLVQKITKAGVKNPLFLLDEIDKMGMDHRGDPSSALLEVLDPEQNSTFNDHYLEVDMDLSDVLFICTSNSMNIPGPLLDRMEIIRIPGYTEDEKLNIAKKYLIPKQMKQSGLKSGELVFTDEAILDLIRYYTREAGVRGLEREIAKICRKAVREFALGKMTEALQQVTAENLEHYSGVHKHNYGKAEEEDLVGHVTGLAWTQVGGEILSIEAAIVPGKGRQIHTGSLGDVMKESIQAALTVVRNRSVQLGIRPDFHEKQDIHIHVPEGATPKDGPSAGIGMCTALISALTGIPVRSDVAMTGEITLRGQVLPIGGLKEKLLAAHRGGIKTVVIPDENKRDLKEIPENIKADLDIIAVKWIDEVLEVALTRSPEPLDEKEAEIVAKESAGVKPEPGQLSTH
ncbi:MAG: endopeptidase La [Nitrincola lacisaponensis]|uniref:Lon protease n=1 Tax=Nitrincola lacisaponensis TaxID=267850 RepID=A0A063XZQ0_9GAMM|nr:endopeptidase La [Nitrincola lacisaponensis]KDE38410.1 ATP-dependent protease La Type I [Nitrincola lacisaponensis]